MTFGSVKTGWRMTPETPLAKNYAPHSHKAMPNNTQKPVIRSDVEFLSQVFHTGTFVVPWHQRPYDWGKEQVEELLTDITEAVARDEECYFLGSIMLGEDAEAKWLVNDGQQRMATFSLICAYFARWFSECGDGTRECQALRISFAFGEAETKTHADADKLWPRLTLTVNDKSRYNLAIRGKGLGESGKIKDACECIDTHFSKMEEDARTHIFDFLMQKIEVSRLVTPKGMDPTAVFETINSRGKPLSEFDLIRNYLYSFFNDEAYAPMRETVYDNLERIVPTLKNKAHAYLRCFFRCEYGYLRQSNFYKECRKQIQNAAETAAKSTPASTETDYVFKLIGELSDPANMEIYRTISNPHLKAEDELVDAFNTAARKTAAKRNAAHLLGELQTYTVTYPITFSLARAFKDHAGNKDLAKFIYRQLVNLNAFVMRTAFVSPKFTPSRFEETFATIAGLYRHAAVDERGHLGIEIYPSLEKVDDDGVLDNGKFVKDLSESEFKDRDKAAKLLYGVAGYHQAGVPLDEKDRPVEYILPKDPSLWGGWKPFDPKLHKDFWSRLGNLTVLSPSDEKAPRAADHKSFAKKKPIYAASSLPVLTGDIAKHANWTPEAVEERQRALAKLAAKAWAFDKQ